MDMMIASMLTMAMFWAPIAWVMWKMLRGEW